MSSSLTKRQINRQRWFDRIASYKQSGLSPKAFCEQQQIGLASFQRWRAIVSKEGKPKSAPVNFLPVKLPPSTALPSLALHLGEDLHLEIPAGFDPALLRGIIQALTA